VSVYRPRDKAGKPKSPFWHYDFVITLPDGTSRRFSGSTGLRKKSEAKSYEDAKRLEVTLGTGPAAMTVNQACWRLWDEQGQHLKGDGEKARHLENIRRLLGGDTRLVDLTKEMIADAIRRRAAEPIHRSVRRSRDDPGDRTLIKKPIGLPTGATINRSFTKPLYALLRRAESHWDVPINPRRFPWKDWLFEETTLPGRELAASEEERLWSEIARRPDYWPLLWFIANNGVRVGGALSMTRERTNLERRETWVRKKTKAQGEHWARLTLSPAAIAVVSTELAKHNFDQVWTYVVQRGRKKGTRVPISYAALRMITDRMFKRAGIKKFRRHDLRHDFGSKLLRLTGNLKLVQEKLHHSSIAVTAKFYAHVQDEELVAGTEAVEASRNYPGMTLPEAKKEGKKS
jgi:integrase